ncbi:MAG: glycoside hydrolase family 36 protein, partial [Bacteroidota bacterium]
TYFEIDIYIDSSPRTFSECLQDVGQWWETALGTEHAKIPSGASNPVYSTWYAYHQKMTTQALLQECRLAKELGYDTIIVDDGWQTHDGQRGYDFTGDWEAERFPEMAKFVADVHRIGMQCMLWYSVPFCGVKSKAYQQFKGKFLTENHRWAPVFDPRYPEVRKYLVDKYTQALQDWNLDGFKLDFIDDFHVYPETPAGAEDGRDFASVNLAVDQLISEITQSLKAINPAILIEFRQKYIGPQLRKIGNMFRAFDCPNDSVTNRLRTTDVRLLAGSSRVHSDMITWHPEETTEIAALQLNSILFSVPQISVRLAEQSEQHLRMIRFYTDYFNTNRELLMHGNFRAHSPLENYPLLSV